MFWFGKMMNKFINNFWKRFIFFSFINLGLPATFGFYWMAEIPMKTRLGFAVVMLGLGLFEALVFWTDLSPREK